MAEFNGLRNSGYLEGASPLPKTPATFAPSALPQGPASATGRTAVDESTGEFVRGLRQGALGTEVGLRALAANVGEVAGAPEYAKSQLGEITQIKREMQTLRPSVTSVGDIDSVSSGLRFGAQALGQAIPTIATAAGGALAGRLGARALGARMTPGQAEFTGGALGIFPQEAGESAAQMYESPEAMRMSPGQRLAIAAGKGAVTSAMENVVPAMVIGNVARGVAPALEKGFMPAAKYVGKEAVKAGGLEGLTEGAQTMAGQAAMHLAAPQSESLLPSQDELLTSMAAGFLPGKVMGGVGATAQVARSKMSDATELPANTVRDMINSAQNPRISSFIDTLKPPADVVAGGNEAVANWIHDSGQIDNVLGKAAEVAADDRLPDAMRARAQALVDSGGDPELLKDFTGTAVAFQRGQETGELVKRLASPAMRMLFGRKDPVNDEKFSAMALRTSEDDQPLVQTLTPYLRNTDPEAVQQAIPQIREYLASSASDPAAKMPVGMLAAFAPGKSREALRAATTMMQRMGVLGTDATESDYNGAIDDVLQRQKAWRSLISTNLAPEHGELTTGEMNKLAGILESLTAETATTLGESQSAFKRSEFDQILQSVFGRNAERALNGMQNLIPQSTAINPLAAAQAAAETGTPLAPEDFADVQTGGATLDAGESAGAPTVDQTLGDMNLGIRSTRGDVNENPNAFRPNRWGFLNTDKKTPYDTQNPEHVAFMHKNTRTMDQSGDSETAPMGVVEYAQLTGDSDAISHAYELMPDATPEQLNERFKVLAAITKSKLEPEQIPYNELVANDSPWYNKYGSIRLREPGRKSATLLTTPAQIISQMRLRGQNLTSGLSGAEAALSDFSRALAALMNVQKNGKPAFDRVEVKGEDGKYVPLSSLPESYTIFKGVTVGDARRALGRRMSEQGVSSRYIAMPIGQLRSVYKATIESYRAATRAGDQAAMSAARAEAEAIQNEVMARLLDNKFSADVDMAKRVLNGTSKVPDEKLGARKSDKIRHWSDARFSEMSLQELQSEYDTAAQGQFNSRTDKSADYYESVMNRLRDEVKRRLVRDGMQTDADTINQYLSGEAGTTATSLPAERAVTASGSQKYSDQFGKEFSTREDADAFIDQLVAQDEADPSLRADVTGYTVSPKDGKFVVSAQRTVQRDVPMETDEFAAGNWEAADEDTATAGDGRSSRDKPRLFQEETGKLLHPLRHPKPDVRTPDGLQQVAQSLIRSILRSGAAPYASAKSELVDKINQVIDVAGPSKLSLADVQKFLKSIEHTALAYKIIDKSAAAFVHDSLDMTDAEKRNLRNKVHESKSAYEASKAGSETGTAPSEKFSSADPVSTEPLSEEDRKSIRALLADMLPNATVRFVKELGGMSGSYSRKELGKALIKINVFATDPYGTAFHEAVHDLFNLLADGGHQATIDLLKRVGSNNVIKRQLHKLLDGNPAAQAQLADPEEAAAYLFQFWMNEKIQIGPQNESLFNRMVRAIKNFFGNFDDMELTSKVFTAFSEGALRDSVSRDATLTGFHTSGYQQFKEFSKPLTSQISKITDTVDARFRETNNPHLIKVIDLFNNAVDSEKGGVGYFAAVAQSRNRLINTLNEKLQGYDRDQIDAALEELQNETPTEKIADPATKAIVSEMRGMLNKLFHWMGEKGVTNWKGEPIGFLKNYFPRLWNVDALMSNGDEFVADLLKHHMDDLNGIAITANERALKEWQDSKAGSTSKTETPPKEVEARDIAEAIHAKLVRNNGSLDDATNHKEASLKEAESILGFSPAMAAVNERVLKFVDPKVFSKYFQKDLVFAMTQYISQAAKRAEYAARFGSDGAVLNEMMDKAQEYEREKRFKEAYGSEFKAAKDKAMQGQGRRIGETQAEFEARVLAPVFQNFAEVAEGIQRETEQGFKTYRTAVMALEGTLGHDISKELRQFNSWMMTYQNLRLLPLTLLSSVIDPLGIMMRGGELNHAYKAFTRGMREVVKSWKGEFTSGKEDADVAIAELLGTLEPSSFLDSLGQTYGSMFMTSKARHINDFFFRLNGMEGWNRAMRTQATLAGMDFIKKLKTDPGKNTERYLKELGLTADDIVLKQDGSLDLTSADRRVQQAIMLWVDGAILRPNAAQRPAWASNPKFALLFHLNQFTYSFQKVILERMYKEAKNGNFDPLMVAAAGYVPMMLASNVIRAMIQGAGDEPDWMKGQDSLIDWVKRATSSAGLHGIPGAYMERGVTGAFGPTVQQGMDWFVKDRPASEDIIRALPGQSIYGPWVY